MIPVCQENWGEVCAGGGWGTCVVCAPSHNVDQMTHQLNVEKIAPPQRACFSIKSRDVQHYGETDRWT